MNLIEARTTKNAVRGALRFVDEAMMDKTIPQSMRDALTHLRTSLKTAWSDMAKPKPTSESERLQEQATIGQYIEAQIDDRATDMFNSIYGFGTVTRDEWLTLDDSFDVGRDAFMAKLLTDAPGLFVRGMSDERPEEQDNDMDMSASEAVSDNYVDESGETKTEDGKSFSKSDYAYTPDDTPSHWKLRLTKTPGGDPDSGIVGAAAAALGAGFRGQKVQIPNGDIAAVKAKVRAAWAKANPDKKPADMPDGIKESADVDLTGDIVMLSEADAGKTTIPIKIIQPGWGSSGYYSKEVLARDGPKVFPAGTHMYMDHPTPQEEASRPERSVKDLAAVTMTDAQWLDEGADGPGLYTEAKPFSDSANRIKEMAKHIGVSIRASGQAENGEIEGRKGPIVKAITNGKSVDFVTQAGAGGKILSESARNNAAVVLDSSKEGPVEKEFQERLNKLETENARLREGALLREAKDFVSSNLPGNIPALTRTRLVESLSKSPPVKDGAIDTEVYVKSITEAAKAEMEYLAQATGSGQVRGMGMTTIPEFDAAKVENDLATSFMAIGMSESAAKLAAKGRN